MHLWTVLQDSNPYIKYCRRRCRDKNSTTVWYGLKYVCHSRESDSAKMTQIKILFPLCTCPMHIWTVFQVSSPCIKYFRRIFGDKNSTTVWYGPKYVCHSRGYYSAKMTKIKISVSFMHMSNAYLNCVLSFKSLHQILREKLRRQEQY